MNCILNKQSIGDNVPYGRVEILKNEVKKSEIFFNKLKENETLTLNEDRDTITVFFLYKGNASFKSNDDEFEYNEKAVFVTLPEYKVEVLAKSECQIVEIKWPVLRAINKDDFPYTKAYLDSEQYRDASKSDKTISRMIIPNTIIPGFSLGSVQTTGIDRIAQHCHPLQDQIFFSFDNNDINLLIDDEIKSLESNTFVHIPLASNHGVEVEESKVAHYLWVDFEI
jgi:hypothetical protein